MCVCECACEFYFRCVGVPSVGCVHECKLYYTLGALASRSLGYRATVSAGTPDPALAGRFSGFSCGFQ